VSTVVTQMQNKINSNFKIKMKDGAYEYLGLWESLNNSGS